MKDHNLLALASMLLLTLTGVLLARQSGFTWLILVIFLIKSFLVASFFMELRHTHILWRMALMLMLCAVFGVVWIVRETAN